MGYKNLWVPQTRLDHSGSPFFILSSKYFHAVETFFKQHSWSNSLDPEPSHRQQMREENFNWTHGSNSFIAGKKKKIAKYSWYERTPDFSTYLKLLSNSLQQLANLFSLFLRVQQTYYENCYLHTHATLFF